MTRMSCIRFVLAAAAIAVLLALTPNVADARGPLYRATYPSKITHKLWQGVANVTFSWVEIPIEINHEIQDTDPFTGTVVGLGKGIFYTGQRMVLGVVDVATFPVDLYGNNYQSIQRTDFPFIDEVE